MHNNNLLPSDQRIRILVVDDNPSIIDDFRKILEPPCSNTALAEAELALFDDEVSEDSRAAFHIDCASQGEEGVAKVRQALTESRPFAIAFIDVRMPPGIDGIDTTRKIWEHDPDIQVVICTAYSDYSWEEIRKKLGRTDRLVILKKPFDSIEVQQLADTLSEKWRRAQQTKLRLATLDQLLAQRARSLQEDHERRTTTLQLQALNTLERRRRLLDHELQHALERSELSVHYQPLVDIASRRAVSLEALVRWQHPRLGLISPAEFIPLAEHTGLILPLGEFVLHTACEQMMRWQRERIPAMPVAVNISAVQLQRLSLRQVVRNVLRDTGLPPQQLVLELTESALVQDIQKHLQDLQGLRTDGVRIEIDDFGTGYSSLSYLRHLPIDMLKIDRSFINQVDTNAADAAIVGAILNMAHTLGLTVIAEGVETAAQLEVLRRNGCETAQGFFFSRPLPPDQCRRLLLDLAKRPAFSDTLRRQLAAGECSRPRRALEH